MRILQLIPTALVAAATCLVAQAQSPSITGLANNAAAAVPTNTIAPGEVININGSNLGDPTTLNCLTTTGTPLSCGGVSVTIAGKAAAVSKEGASQVVVEVPVDAPVANGQQLVLTRAFNGLNFVSQAFQVNVIAVTPQLFTNNANGMTFASCYLAATLVTPTNPVKPGGSVTCIGTGFGLSNPVVPTGTLPSGPLPPVVAQVAVTFAGKNISFTATESGTGGTPGNNYLGFTIPQGIGGGAQPMVVSVNGVALPTYHLWVAGTGVTNVQNAASEIVQGLPNAGIAQGALFVAYGIALGPATISISPTAFQSTNLSGTSVAVTVGATTVNALMYYTSATQVSALLPSNTPTGAGSVTVTYNGVTSAPSPITVVQNNLGIFTVDYSGQGPGIVTYPDYSSVSAAKASNCGGPYTACGAANPGDVLTLWATGLGPVNGSDAAGAGLGLPIKVPLTVWLGGVAITPSYQGRSGCCIAEDEIVFTVPNDVPTGCAVPLLIQINDQISNNTVMPVSPKGSRNCTPTNAALASVNVEQAVMAGPISAGDIRLEKILGGTLAIEDVAQIEFNKLLTYTPGTQPFFVSFADAQPLGACIVYNNIHPSTNVPAATSVALDAGSSFTVNGPNGSVAVQGSTGNLVTLSSAATFLVPGTFTVAGTGGADVGPFTATITVPALPTLLAPASNATITRANGMTVTWTGGSGNVLMTLAGDTDATHTNGAFAYCSAPASAGTFTIPPYILQALPSLGGFTLGSLEVDAPFTAAGLDLGILRTSGVGPLVLLTLN